MTAFTSIRLEGGLLGPDLLEQVLTGEAPGQKTADFGLEGKRNLTDEIAAVFADARALWQVFQHRRQRLPDDDPATTVTRDAWVIPLLGLFGYELRYNQRAFDVGGLNFAISHRAGDAEDAPPVHIVGAGQKLGLVAASGRPRLAPHSLVQEYLNRTEHVWGIVTNGLTLRILRDSTFVRRQAYVEFDLVAILDENRFQDFVALYRLLHRTRLPRGQADAGECLLEKYYLQSVEQGGRVREHLRDGVEECITRLANGFLHHPANVELRQQVEPTYADNDRISPESLYRQLLRLVYRFLFLLVSEDRGLLSSDPIYREYYGIARLRQMLDSHAAYTEHDDLWQSLRVLWRVLGDDRLAELLRLAPLNGELFSPQALDACSITNRDLLEAFWRLTWYQEDRNGPARRVNYAALNVEELGSVYESLLEFHPAVDHDAAGRPGFSLIFGSERKTTGSYYTPPQLVAELVRTALNPVIQARLDAGQREQEKALLSIRVCDPACGSGHFLLAAARRIGKELARVRTGEEEPAPEQNREAIRDVISHCIYGVDRNPLAVDLCRVALWLESNTGHKPLTFLDHRIRCGDSLVGVFDLESLKNGIPDKAFEPFEGDDRTYARDVARQNRSEREGQIGLFAWKSGETITDFTRHNQQLDGIADDSPENIRRKKQLFEQNQADPEWQRQHLACDLWTAAFYQPLQNDGPIITTAALVEHLAGRLIEPRLIAKAMTLSARQGFFHWPLEFPEVFINGGFDVILSNPPWERVKLQEQEFFSVRDARIANARNKAARTTLIRELPRTNPELYRDYVDALRASAGISSILRHGGRYPHTGQGDINTYAVFAELSRALIRPNGRSGIIVPSGLATDNTTKDFFGDLVFKQALESFFEFENEGFFPGAGQGHMLRFALTTIVGSEMTVRETRFLFQGKHPRELADKNRVFTLSATDIALVNPNTKTCPIFRSRCDAELTKAIYARVPILMHDDVHSEHNANPWGISFLRMFDMANDSHLFKTKDLLEKEGYTIEGNRFHKEEEVFVPLFEAKMVYQYNHRHGDFRDSRDGERAHVLPALSAEQLRDPLYLTLPYYWVPEVEVKRILGEKDWESDWLIGWRDVTDARASARTLIASVIPRGGVNDKFLIMLPKATAKQCAALLGNLCSLVCDYIARQKVGGLALKYFTMKQFPVLSPSKYNEANLAFIVPRVLELTYTARDLDYWAHDCGYDGPPFAFDEERRFELRCELDSFFFNMYIPCESDNSWHKAASETPEKLAVLEHYLLTPRDAVSHILDQFPIVRHRDEQIYSRYRTKERILEIYDAMLDAQRSGRPYQTRLNPPPGVRP